ncbi:MAG: glycoside hydrolase family 5 protein [Candidatus Hydrothermae bacterium]|nr:glycoside hydrolase family 5 protein [Candidatus Hydrothermae bacterium]
MKILKFPVYPVFLWTGFFLSCHPSVLPRSAEITFLPGVHIAEKATQSAYLSDIDLASVVHAYVIRVPVDWAALEPDSGVVDHAYLQEITQRLEYAHQRGIRVVLLFTQSPYWASGSPDPAMPPRPGYEAMYAFALKNLYLSLSDPARDALIAVEIWNEPNSIEFWPRYSNPRQGTYVLVPLHAAAEYAQLLQISYQILKPVMPHLSILGGSLASADTAYLHALFTALDTSAPSMDGLALHPYTRVDEHPGDHYGYAQYPDQCNLDDPLSPPWCFQEGLHITRELLNQSGYPQLPIWITEFGVSSDTGWGDAGSEEEQALHLQISLQILRDSARNWNVISAIWYRLRDEGPDHFGLFTEQNQKKRSAERFQSFFQDVLP